MENLKEQSLRVQKGGKSRLCWFWPRVPAEKPDPQLPAYYFLCFIVYFLGLGACWGADMRGRIVNYIFLMFRPMRIRFFHRLSGLRPFRLRLLSFAEVFQIQLIDMLNTQMRLSKLDVKGIIVTGYPRSSDFISFLDPRRLFFQIRIRIRIFFV